MYVIPWQEFLSTVGINVIGLLASAIADGGATFTEEADAQNYQHDAMLQRARGLLNGVGSFVETVTIERDGVPVTFVTYTVTTVISATGLEYMMRLARERLELSRAPVPLPTPLAT